MRESDLPEEVLAVLPADPYDQLDIARRITAMAVASQVDMLELEASNLRQKLAEKECLVSNLQARIGELQQAVQQTNARLSDALHEQSKLAMEKNALEISVKKLSRDFAKLEMFKKTLMQSLQEEDESQPQAGGDKQWISSALEEESSSVLPPRKDSSAGAPHPYSLTSPNLTPQLTPSGSPIKRHSTSISPRAVSPRAQSTRGSPKRHSLADGRLSLPASLPASKHPTAPNSPPHARSHTSSTARVDGKEFFKQARNRLSYEQFSAFLTTIKELNAHKQTREETLRRASEIFGPDNEDLYHAFDSLLSRHLPPHG